MNIIIVDLIESSVYLMVVYEWSEVNQTWGEVCFEIGWLLTFGMKVNRVAQRTGVIGAPLYANSRCETYRYLVMTHIARSRISHIWKAVISKLLEFLGVCLLARLRQGNARWNCCIPKHNIRKKHHNHAITYIFP